MYDILIKDAIIIDGTNEPRYKGDVAILDGKIKKIKRSIDEESAKKIINAANVFYLTPGFIDINNHSDTYLTLFTIPSQESLLKQGVTTILGGNCGSSLAPLVSADTLKTIQKWTDTTQINLNWQTFEEFLDTLEKRKIGVNFASLVGHSTLRRGLLKDELRKLSPKELKIVKEMLKSAIKQGAFGMSTGLAYTHAKIAPKEEIIELTKTIKSLDGLYTTHIRGEAEELIPAIEETIETAKKTGVRTQISHLKAMGEKYWPNMKKAIGLIEEASEKIDINFDVYPYSITGSVLYILLPDWVAEGGKKMLLDRLKDPVIKAKVIQEMQDKKAYEYNKITLAISPINKSFIGKKITEIAQAQNISVEEAIINMLIISEARTIVFLDTLSEENIKTGISHPLSFVASDGVGYNLAYYNNKNNLVHPRCFGAFPRLFAKYVRSEHLLRWEEAVYKVTGGPAKKIGLEKRGLIKNGYWADLVLINPGRINDKSSFENPYQYPDGIKCVIVNGKLAVENGAYLGEKAGKVLRKK